MRTPQLIGLNNVKLYAAADKFGIDSLKDLAKRRFNAWYKEYCGDELAEVTRQALQCTPPHDHGLREEVLNALKPVGIDEHREIMDNDDLTSALEDSDVLKDRFRNMLAWNIEDIENYQNQMQTLQSRVVCSECSDEVVWDEYWHWYCPICAWTVEFEEDLQGDD